MKKVLVIVPHEDDEINVIGTIIHQLENYEITIVFVTNGDYDSSKTYERIKESNKVAKIIGAKTIYLGYLDSIDRPHLYNVGNNTPIIDKNGRNQTYCVNGIKEYCFEKNGYHHLFVTNNLVKDMEQVIRDINAEIIFSIDYDSHPDHRMVSLVFDIVMKKLIVDGYKPIVLKKFAYLGVWFGKKDFFIKPFPRTLPIDITGKDKMDECLPYLWEDRISFKSDDELCRIDFWNTKLYKMLKIYKTQNAKKHFFSIANSDTVYWYKDYRNLALTANVEVSSGNKTYLNDFLFCNTNDVCSNKTNEEKFEECCWIPDKIDNDKYIIFRFNSSINIKRIVIHQNFKSFGQIRKIKIKTNGFDKVFLCKGIKQTFEIESKIKTKFVKIEILSFEGERSGFREIELFENDNEFPLDETPFKYYDTTADTRNPFICLLFDVLVKISILIRKTIDFLKELCIK